MTFNPSWLMRPARAPFTTPNVGDVRFVSTELNCGVIQHVERLEPELQLGLSQSQARSS